MIGYYAEVDPSGRYVQYHAVTLPSEAEIKPANSGNILVPVAGPPAPYIAKTETEVLYLIDGVEEWVETAPISDLRDKAIARTYADVDAIYEVAIGRRMTEYARAEEAARTYVATEPKPSVVSDYITGHAINNPTGLVQTNEWAAQQIIERADSFRWAELQMRNVRFARQADMRAATTAAGIAAAEASWKDFVVWLRQVLGV